MARYRNGSRGAETRRGRRIETVAVVVPVGRALCDCGAVVSLTLRGNLRSHRDPTGVDCPNRTKLELDQVDVGVVARALALEERRAETLAADGKPYGGRGTLLRPDGHCHGELESESGELTRCAKPVTGERRYCGACLSRRRL